MRDCRGLSGANALSFWCPMQREGAVKSAGLARTGRNRCHLMRRTIQIILWRHDPAQRKNLSGPDPLSPSMLHPTCSSHGNPHESVESTIPSALFMLLTRTPPDRLKVSSVRNPCLSVYHNHSTRGVRRIDEGALSLHDGSWITRGGDEAGARRDGERQLSGLIV